MNHEQYIEHEVQIRVLKEMSDVKQKNTDDKFMAMEKRIDDRFSHIDYKINLIIGIAIAALLLPLLKTALGVL